MNNQYFLLTAFLAAMSLQCIAAEEGPYLGPIDHSAASAGDLETVKGLVETENPSFMNSDRFGQSALHRAAGNGKTDVVCFLARVPVFHVANRLKNTPLHEAARNGHLPAVRILAEIPAFQIRNWCGDTPLHSAVRGYHPEVVRALVKIPAFHVANDKGCTPLHCAALYGNLEVIEFLLNYFPRTTKDARGNTPEQLARNHGHKQAAKLIKEWPTNWSPYNHLIFPQKDHTAIRTWMLLRSRTLLPKELALLVASYIATPNTPL